MKKLPQKLLGFPWGIVCGVCAIIAFYCLFAFVGVNIVLGGVAGQTNETISIFENWYQSLIFAVVVVTATAAIASLAMFIIREITYKREGSNAAVCTRTEQQSLPEQTETAATAKVVTAENIDATETADTAVTSERTRSQDKPTEKLSPEQRAAQLEERAQKEEQRASKAAQKAEKLKARAAKERAKAAKIDKGVNKR